MEQASFRRPAREAKVHPVIARAFPRGSSADRMSPDAIARFREEALAAVVQRAYAGSRLYREKMDRAGVRPEDIRSLSNLRKLPFLTKEELRGRPRALLACDPRDIALIQVSTGTTGGEEIYIEYTLSDYLANDLTPRYSTLFPVAPGDVCLDALPYEMSTAGLAFHKTFMDGYGAAVIPAGKGGAYSTPEKTVKVISDLRPNIAVTSPSWAIILAEAAAKAGFALPSLGMKRMWLTGEGCSPALRGRIERLWGSPASFFYGSLECGVLGMECEAQEGYHLPEAHVILEVVDPRTGEPLPEGEIGELVVTALLRFDSPLLRFRTGDMGFIVLAPCRCGSPLSRFHMRGRAVDQLTVAGRSLSPIYLEELLLRMPEVGPWYEIVAPRKDASRLAIRAEPAVPFTPDAALAAALSAKISGAAGFPIDVDLVARLPRPTAKVTRVVRE